MDLETTKWDVVDYLESDEDIAHFLEAAFDDGDPAVITAALGAVARAKGMTQLAKDTGLAREALYRSLSAQGKPEFTTVLKVMKAFGLRLTAVPLDDKAA
ncbi:MAG: putative addiction module antidote protein [Hyphomicrobiales bacterium]|nr:MAG: putative addiction module antidote protein [Hyphomicrobiales bacterium]